MPVTLCNLRSVVAQVTRGGARSVIVSRLRNLSSMSRRGKPYYSGSIVESGLAYYKAILPLSMAGLASFYAWDIIQMSENEVKKRDVEKLNGLESKTPQHNVLREAWRSLIHR